MHPLLSKLIDRIRAASIDGRSIRQNHLAKAMQLTNGCITRWVRQGLFPKPINLPGGRVLFDVEQVIARLLDINVNGVASSRRKRKRNEATQ